MTRQIFAALCFIGCLPAAASLMGCQCDDYIITDEFESFCDGAPCNWEATGPVSQVPTYHSEVNGVALPAGSSIRALEAFGDRAPHVLVLCDPGALLRINGAAVLTAPTDLYTWVGGRSGGNTVLSVEGTGQCIVDDIGLQEFCL